MNAPKFTPGPWQRCAGKRAVEIRGSFFGMSSTPRVCRVLRSDPLSDGNSRLIAAAPELYEALERFCIAYERDTALRPAAMANACNLARAALAVAGMLP